MLPVCATRCKCATRLREAVIVAERQHVRRTNLCRRREPQCSEARQEKAPGQPGAFTAHWLMRFAV